MISGFSFTICNIIYNLLLMAVYFLKKRINSFDNKIYRVLIIVNFCGLLIELCCFLAIMKYGANVISLFFSKMLLVYFLSWISVFTIYVIAISYNNGNIEKKVLKTIYYTIPIFLIILLLIFVLPLYIFKEGNIIYSYGPGAYLLYVIVGICVLISLIVLIKNYHNLKNKKFIPIITYLLIGPIIVLIQNLNPGLLLITFGQTLVTFLMYFTIENPDMKMIEQLNIAKDQANKANQAKSEFLSSMSHEIRTPLNAIVGFGEALKEENLPDEAMDEVNDIIMASESLVDIVNGILDISKIEANKLEIINVEYSFRKIFDDLVTLTKARLGDKPLDFRVIYDESVPGVLYGDANRLKQIVLNLLTNAVKYTKEGFLEFRVNSVIKDNICRLIITVEDSGIGIKKENIDKLFTKFERLQVEKQTTVEGTGLGLAITKKLVELMHGKIIVQSEYGKGSKFIVAIDQYIVKMAKESIKEVKSDLEIIDATGKRILVVDDNIVNLKVASRLLLKYKATVDTANSGNECIDKVMANKYDLILMDDMMPKMSGTETLNNLKEIAGFNIPTVALTANAISGMKEKYLKDGFNDYLSKPIELKELNRVIIRYLK